MNVPHRIWPLPRGIHPPANKTQSLRDPIRVAPLPPRLVIPLAQPGHTLPEVCVEPGQYVAKGQVLARGTPTMGLACHASSSGTVVEIAPHAVPNASTLPEPCVVIATDGHDEWQRLPPLDWLACDPDDLIARIHDAGISGLGGAGFPTHAKLRGALGRAHTLVINAAECEPYITADAALMRERAVEVITGILILLRLCGAERCLIGIEDDKPGAIAAMAAALTHVDDPRVRQVVIPAQYPSGAEKQLIYILTGTEIPSGSFALASGILCQNVGTAYAIARAVLHGEALVSRIVTLTGAAVARPGNVEALVGTPLDFLLADAALDDSAMSRLIHGGPLMGLHLPRADVPLLKITNCVIATTADELPAPPPAQACIRCGFCTDVCPVGLLPQQLYWFARGKELEKAERHNLMDCIECGACAYACPSHIPLVQYYRAAKAELREEREKHRMAEHSRERFEFHQARKAEEKALEEQRRAERAALAKRRQEAAATGATPAAAPATSPTPEDLVKAALERVNAKKAARAAAADDTPGDKGP